MNIKKYTILVLFFNVFFLNANADDMAELKAQMKAMQQQMQLMQQKLDEQQKKLEQQEEMVADRQPSDDSSENTLAHEIADSITVSGALVVNAGRTDSDGWSGESHSDIILDTLELGIDTQVTPWVNGHILFLYEQDDNDNLLVDEGTITIGNQEVSPFYLSAGRMYLPFGNFSSHMISDPITLTLGETREEAIQIGMDLDNGLYTSAYVFNGKIDEADNTYSRTSNSHIDNFGFNIGYILENDNMSLDIGMGYINNIASSDGLQDSASDNALCGGDGCIKDYVGGLSLHAVVSFGDVSFIGEYVGALEEFEASEVSSINTKKLQPKTWNIEAGYHFNLMGKNANIAVAYQASDEFYLATDSTDHFEKAWLLGMNVDIYKNTVLSFEWRHAKAEALVKDAIEAAGEKYENENLLQMNLSIAF